MNIKVWVLILSLTWLTAIPVAGQIENQTRRFNVSQGGTLIVEVQRSDIRVRTGSGGTVEVDAVGLNERHLDGLEISQSGNTVRVEYDGRDGRFDILVPTTFNLELESHRGDIKVSGTVDGNVAVETASGDVSLDDVEGDVTIATAGGDITGGTVGGSADIATAGGDIQFVSVQGDVKVATGGGDIAVGEIGGDLNAGSGAGDVEIGNVGGTVSLATGGGDVSVGTVTAGANLTTAGGDVQLAGAQGRIVVTTAGGDLELVGLEGSLKATTAGGDIMAELTADGGEGDNRLTSAGGDITLYLDPSVGVTVECLIHVSDWEDDASRLDIRSEFGAFQSKRDPAAGKISGTVDINGGGTLITINTIDGDIRLKRLGQ